MGYYVKTPANPANPTSWFYIGPLGSLSFAHQVAQRYSSHPQFKGVPFEVVESEDMDQVV